MRFITDDKMSALCGKLHLENLLHRQELSTTFETAGRGVQRRYTLENAIEIGLCEAFRRAGLKASSAVAYTAIMLRQQKQPQGMPHYVVFLDGDHVHARPASDLNSEAIKSWASQASSVAIVSTRDVIGRVEAIFDVYGEEAA